MTLATTPISLDHNTVDVNNSSNKNKHQSYRQPQQQQEKRSLFLTIDHKLAIRRRNTGSVRSYEECEIMSTAVPSISPSNEISKSTAILATNDDINNNNKCSTSEFITNEMSPKQQQHQQQQHHHQMAIINEHGDDINHESKVSVVILFVSTFIHHESMR